MVPGSSRPHGGDGHVRRSRRPAAALGKRTLAKLNAFDLVVTVALGSTLATVLLSQSVSWAEGIAALATLVVLQLVVAVVAARVPGGRAAVTSRPRLVLHEGRLDEAALRRNRVAPEEVRQVVRKSGQGDLSQVVAVVLETDGSFSVIPRSAAGDRSALADVLGEPAPGSSAPGQPPAGQPPAG